MKYRQPPIREAVCEFHFLPQERWDGTVPGRFYELVKKDFPKREEQAGYQVSIDKEGAAAFGQAPPRMLFRSANGAYLTQVWPFVLTVNNVPNEEVEYAGWQRFSEKVKSAFLNYVKVLDATAVSRIGLRYINRIASPFELEAVGELISENEYVAPRLLRSSSEGMSRVGVPVDDRKLWVTTGTHTTGNDKFVIVDIDCIWEGESPVNWGTTSEILEGSHRIIADIFEAFLTKDLRDRFGVVEV